MQNGQMLRLCAAICTCLAVTGAHAQSAQSAYPNRPVTVVLPLAPGGVGETEGRIHLGKLTENLGQPFVLDFKPGGGTIIGMAHVARAVPDGYTLLMVSSSYSLIPLMSKPLPFDPIKSFEPVSLISKRYSLMMVHPSVPSDLREFVAYARANSDKVNFGSGNLGGIQHLTGAWFAALTGIRMTYVHYKGAGPIIPDILAGRIQVTPMTLTVGMPHIKAGKLKALGLANLERNPAFPDISTLAEQGLKEFEYSSWGGLLAPAKTPSAIITQLSAEVGKAVRSQEVVKRLGLQTQLLGTSPDQFREHIATEVERWRKLVKELGIVLEE